ncbi:MAG TPA: hypothetical protein VGJ13_07775 [Pseudonocardiaceae bacterium]|jgi:hypothetical protein
MFIPTDADMRHRDIDSAAAFLLSGTAYTTQQWRRFADCNPHTRTGDVYARCAELAAARQELGVL